LSEHRLLMLNNLLDHPTATFPNHITDTLNLLRQNAEEDLSNILHIQSIFPSSLPNLASTANLVPKTSKPKQSPVKVVQAVFGDSRAVLGQVEEDVEAGVAVTDDLFLMEGVDPTTNTQLRSPLSTFSDEERDDSELDEGIHIPSKFSNKKTFEVAASLPVGIPWPAQLTGSNTSATNRELAVQGGEAKPRDIAASIQAMAKSVHTSSIFGDNTFGDLPRPRLNTYTKE